MTTPFFPNLEFGWAYFGTLVGILLVSSWIDLKKMVIPKWLTLPTLALGLLFNVVRGVLLSQDSSSVWLLEPGSVLTGALDGALFAVAGFATAFGLFFLMWLLGACGGGDVKLCAAVGTWIGPSLVLRLLLITIVIVPLFMLFQVLLVALSGDLQKPTTRRVSATDSRQAKPRRRLLIFSPPLALATALLLLWTFRVELQLMPAAAPTDRTVTQRAGTN